MKRYAQSPRLLSKTVHQNPSTLATWHVTYNADNKRAQSPSRRRGATAILRLVRGLTSARARSGIPRRSGNIYRPILFSNDTAVVEMAYDYMGRRFEYKETVSGTLTRHESYLYRGYLQIAALDMLNSASIKRTTVWDPTELSATRPLILRVGADAYYYSFHQIKNVTELFDSAGALAATYDYSPFGELVSSTGTIANPITFSSEVQDSTLGLQYYNYRHLNVLDGRWVNRDPIEDVSFFAQKNLEFHHYIKLSLSHTKGEMLYCGNQTLFNSDLLGLFCSEPKCRKRDIQHTYYFEIKIPMSDFAVNLSAAYRLQESECSIECGNCRCGVKTSKKETYSGAMGGTFTIRIPGSLIRIGEVAFDVGATGYKEENFNSCTGVRTQYDELGFFANVSGGPCIFISSVAKWCVKCNISCSWQANAWSGRSSSECNGGCYFETCVFGICSVIPLGKNDRR